MNKLIIGVFAALISGSAIAQSFTSGPEQVPLLELYTSEGCSSCPPADKWISQLTKSEDLWTSVVPIAFHVDYWNYLGWPDRFSHPKYAQRQRRFQQQGYTSGVYTPGVILNGQEWRQWGRTRWPFSPVSEAGVLNVDLNGGKFEATYNAPSNKPEQPRLHIAILGFAQTSDVKAGENRGKALNHDFVVLGYQQFASTYASWSGKLPNVKDADDNSRLGIAAWVSNGNDLQPLQATGGWLPSS